VPATLLLGKTETTQFLIQLHQWVAAVADLGLLPLLGPVDLVAAAQIHLAILELVLQDKVLPELPELKVQHGRLAAAAEPAALELLGSKKTTAKLVLVVLELYQLLLEQQHTEQVVAEQVLTHLVLAQSLA
jgi:hypothetical protein